VSLASLTARRILSADWVLPVEGEPIPDGAVAIEDGRIAAVGPASELGADERFADSAIVPGFVNAHSHLEYAVYSGFGDGLPFSPWLAVHVERKSRIGWDEMLASARLGAAECLRSGVTTVADYSFSAAGAAACAELGLRGIVYLEVFGAEPESAREQYERKAALAEEHASERVRLGVSPHAPYTCSLDVYAWCKSLGVPVGTHLAESVAEHEWLVEGRGDLAGLPVVVEPLGETGIRALARGGLLGPELLAAHCVHVDSEEIGLLAEHGVGVAHCPRSNAALGCGIAPLAELRAATGRVGLGTDSPASTPPFDVFAELAASVLFARARAGRPDALSASDALELATLVGARALGLDAEIGSLVPGKRADLAVVSLEGSSYLPWEDPAGAVVFGGSPERVICTLVDGHTRYDREEFEWLALTGDATRARRRLLAAAPSTATTTPPT
jgi:cytosine/adenosine deaminase-related metal-dependent hydrolase